jgi:actin-related protein
MRELFMRYDEAKTPEEKAKALEKIREKVAWDHNYTKPTNLKRIKKNVEEVKGGAAEDTSEEEDPELAGYKSEFKAEEQFNRQALVDQFITNNNASQIHPVSKYNLNVLLIEILTKYRLC